MKNVLITTVLGFGVVLSGCSTTANFFELTPQPSSLTGVWTGPHQNISIATIIINNDGNGLVCQDYNGSARVTSVKRVGRKIYSQDGGFWNIKNESQDKFDLAYGLGGSYQLVRDSDYKNLTPACKDKLKV